MLNLSNRNMNIEDLRKFSLLQKGAEEWGLSEIRYFKEYSRMEVARVKKNAYLCLEVVMISI